jgi:predicted nucleotidyltransferase
MSAITWPDRSALPPADYEERLARRLAGRVERAYFFGSYATGEAKPGSDVDLILVLPTKVPFLERARLFDDLYEFFPRLDLLVYSPEEFEDLRSNPRGFWASVVASLRPLPLA